MVPDPAGILVQDPSAPQSWNLYSYVLNNPLGAVDPNGLDCVYASASDVPGGDTSQLIPGANGTFIKTGDCISDTDNGFYFDGTVDPNSVGFNPNGDVVANVNDNTGCSGDCPDSLISATASDQENDVIWGIGGGQGALVLQTAGLEATHGLNCAGYGFLTSGGTALFKLGQPVVGSKPFITPGSSKGTSPLSEALRDALPGKLPFGARVPTLVGGMGTGTPLRIKPQAKVGAALGRAAPFLGAAVTAYSAYKFSQCLSEVPK